MYLKEKLLLIVGIELILIHDISFIGSELWNGFIEKKNKRLLIDIELILIYNLDLILFIDSNNDLYSRFYMNKEIRIVSMKRKFGINHKDQKKQMIGRSISL